MLTQQSPGGCWMMWKVQLPLGERRMLEHKGTGRPSSPRQGHGGQKSQDHLEAQGTDIPPLLPALLPETPGWLQGEGLLHMAAQRGDMNSDGQSISDRTDPLRKDRLPLPPLHSAGPREGRGTTQVTQG